MWAALRPSANPGTLEPGPRRVKLEAAAECSLRPMSVDMKCPRCSASVPAGAHFCAACGAALGDGALEERKLVTVLFADITGSTTLGERFDPERWRIRSEERRVGKGCSGRRGREDERESRR